MPREILIKITPGSSSMVDLYHKSAGSVVLKEFKELGWQHVRLSSSLPVANAINYYSRLSGVESATPNRMLHAEEFTPNDPMYGQQYSPKIMRASTAWDLTKGDDTVVVAVLDTGVDYTHPDLAGKVTKGRDHADNDDDPMDPEGHGTHVAGTIGASTNNGIGVAGIGFNVKILAIRVLGLGGGSEAMIVGGIDEARQKKADIINMSLGGYFASQSIEDAVNAANAAGVVVMGAAGNGNTNAYHSPSSIPTCISVGSTDSGDQKSDFSNWGPDVDVAAPGSAIMSTLPGNQYGLSDGTSMACPNAAGVAALVISFGGKGFITNDEVRFALESTAKNVGSWVTKGRIDAELAVNAAIPPLTNRYQPVAARMFDGRSFTGGVSSLQANDSTFFTVFSRLVANLGGVAGMGVDFPYTYTADKFISGNLVVRGSAKYGTTATAYIQKRDGTFVKLKSWPVSGTQITTNVAVPKDITPYLTDTGRLKFVVRGVLPTRFGTSTYSYSFNSAFLDTKSKSR